MNTESKLYQCHYQARDSRNRTKTHCNSQSYKPPRWDHYLSMEEWAIPVCRLLGDNTYVHHSIGQWGGAADHREEYKIISTNLSQWVWKPWGSVCPMFLERTGFQLIDPTRDQGWLLLCPSMAIQRVNVYWILGSCPASELEEIHNLI